MSFKRNKKDIRVNFLLISDRSKNNKNGEEIIITTLTNISDLSPFS